MTTHTPYAIGHAPSHTQHHAWRTASNSAAHLLPHLRLALQKNPHLKLLDVGAGPGTISASLAQHLLPSGHVVATEIADDILARARTHAEEQGLGPDAISFQRASVYELPFADGEFDVVHAHQVLCHLDAPVAALREMLRVCKPGGLVALREADMRTWCVWPEIEGVAAFQDLSAAVLVANGGKEKGGRMLVGWVMAAGVERERIEAGFGTWCFSDPEERRMWGESCLSCSLLFLLGVCEERAC